jgi:cytochrome c
MLLFVFVFLSGFIKFLQTDKKSGKYLFNENCSSCHRANKEATGPPLQRIREHHSLEWICNFVHNPTKMYAEGDTEAVMIFNYYNHTMMLAFPTLTDSEIVSILDYVDSFPYNPKTYGHRKVSEKQKAKYLADWSARKKYDDSLYKDPAYQRYLDTLYAGDTLNH